MSISNPVPATAPERRPVIRTDHGGARHHHAPQRPYLERLESALEEAFRRAFVILDRGGSTLKSTAQKPVTDMTPRDFVIVAAALQAKRRASLTRLSSAGRLRKWGQ